MSRQPPPAPGQELSDFPVEVLAEGREVFRSHHRDRGPCFFNGSPDFRFNLGDGEGTCYVGDDVATAVREKMREQILAQGIAPAGLVGSFLVSSIVTGSSFDCADIGSADAIGHGVTRMLATMDDYEVTRQWATAFNQAAFDGIRYGSSFTNGAATAWALFGDAGEHPFGEVSAVLTGAEACATVGIEVYRTPHSDELDFA